MNYEETIKLNYKFLPNDNMGYSCTSHTLMIETKIRRNSLNANV